MDYIKEKFISPAGKMKSLPDRFNNILYNFAYGAVGFGLLNYIIAYYGPHTVNDISFELAKIGTFLADSKLEEDAASFTFNFSGDLTGLFNWNTNIIFLSLQCEFETEKGYRNEVTVWDQRIPREEPKWHKPDLKDEWVEYWLTDRSKSLRGKDIKVFLRWEQMTTIGPYYSGKVPIGSFQMPDDYSSSVKRRAAYPGPSNRQENY